MTSCLALSSIVSLPFYFSHLFFLPVLFFKAKNQGYSSSINGSTPRVWNMCWSHCLHQLLKRCVLSSLVILCHFLSRWSLFYYTVESFTYSSEFLSWAEASLSVDVHTERWPVRSIAFRGSMDAFRPQSAWSAFLAQKAPNIIGSLHFHFLSLVIDRNPFGQPIWGFSFTLSAPVSLDGLDYGSLWCSIKVPWWWWWWGTGICSLSVAWLRQSCWNMQVKQAWMLSKAESYCANRTEMQAQLPCEYTGALLVRYP